MTTTHYLQIASRTMKSSNQVVTFFLPVNPIPASRPRVSKWGVFYGKCYTAWRKEAAKALQLHVSPHRFTEPLRVTLVHSVRKPKSSKRDYPRGDVDNYDKAVLDAITSHTDLWNDDDQIVHLRSSKVFTTKEEHVGCYIRIEVSNLTLPDKIRNYISKLFDTLWQ